MSDCRKIQAMDVLLTQEWTVTATLLQSSGSEWERFQGGSIDRYMQKLGQNGRERKGGMNGPMQQQLLLKTHADQK